MQLTDDERTALGRYRLCDWAAPNDGSGNRVFATEADAYAAVGRALAEMEAVVG